MRDRIAAFLWRNLNVFDQNSILQETLRQRLVDDLEVIVTEELDRREREKLKPPVPIPPPSPQIDSETASGGYGYAIDPWMLPVEPPSSAPSFPRVWCSSCPPAEVGGYRVDAGKLR